MKVPSKEEALAMLDDLYAQLPALECKGLCHDSCTGVDASELERERIRARGVELSRASPQLQMKLILGGHQIPRCPALGPLNNCTVYAVRPFTCRAFGLTMDPRAPGEMATFKGPMMCDHGCVPDGTITIGEYYRIIQVIEELSVVVTGVSRKA